MTIIFLIIYSLELV